MEIPEDLTQWRKTQRSTLLARRLAVTQTRRHEWNDAITQFLIDGFPLLQWMTVGFYWPMQGEFDPRFAIRELRRRGATAALPVVLQKRMPLQFREWWPGVPTSPGVFDLPVPQGSAVVRPQALLIPPVGFDARGYRLGYGGGYFDRTLAALDPQPLKIGVAFELSRIATIRPQAYDVPMDFIVTEAGIHHVIGGELQRLDDPGAGIEQAERIMLERDCAARRGAAAAGGDGSSGSSDLRRYASPPCFAHDLEPAHKDA